MIAIDAELAQLANEHENVCLLHSLHIVNSLRIPASCRLYLCMDICMSIQRRQLERLRIAEEDEKIAKLQHMKETVLCCVLHVSLF